MSKSAIDYRDRLDLRSTGNERIRFMVRSGGFVMCRRPRQKPFVLSETEWAKLPVWEEAAQILTEYRDAAMRPRA